MPGPASTPRVQSDNDQDFTNLREILSSILLAINDGGAVERAAVSLMDRVSLSMLA